jgi:hypothetical protein
VPICLLRIMDWYSAGARFEHLLRTRTVLVARCGFSLRIFDTRSDLVASPCSLFHFCPYQVWPSGEVRFNTFVFLGTRSDIVARRSSLLFEFIGIRSGLVVSAVRTSLFSTEISLRSTCCCSSFFVLGLFWWRNAILAA